MRGCHPSPLPPFSSPFRFSPLHQRSSAVFCVALSPAHCALHALLSAQHSTTQHSGRAFCNGRRACIRPVSGRPSRQCSASAFLETGGLGGPEPPLNLAATFCRMRTIPLSHARASR